MKIVHLLPPLTKGGAERVAVELANHAAASGHEVAIVADSPADPALLQYAVSKRVPVTFISKKGGSRLRPYLALLPWLVRNRRWLLEQDVIHCHLTFAEVAGSTVAVIRRLLRHDRPKVIETFHSVGMPIPRSTRGLAAMLARGRDGLALMAEDDFWARFRARNPGVPVRIIPNGVAIPNEPPPAADVAAYRRSAGIPEGVTVIGTVGRLVEGRMPVAFVTIFAEIAKTFPDAHFLMAGEGALAADVRRTANEAGLGDRMHLPGLVLQPALAFANIDLYVSINVGPISGVAGLEAAAGGLPVIALQARADYRGHDDWIWSDPDPRAVGAEAARLLADAQQRRALAKRQKAHVAEKLSIEAMAAAYDRFYADCLGPARS